MEMDSSCRNRPAADADAAAASALRGAFLESGYGSVGRDDVRSLCRIVNEELSRHERGGGMPMMVSAVKERRGDDGLLRSAFVRVDGPYFEDREGISLNADGFVGIAGWADSRNEEPFVRAFGRWLEEAARIRGGAR